MYTAEIHAKYMKNFVIHSVGIRVKPINSGGKHHYTLQMPTKRTRDVWFIFYANYDANMLDDIVDNRHVVNLIQNNGDMITEVIDERFGASNTADRITFVKTNKGYEFYGVYKIINNGATRCYQRISLNYPIEK